MKVTKHGCVHTHFHGLTLIELLLVIGIISMMAGIIWTTFALIRGKARETVCRSNLKTLFLALQMYRQDWDGIDPEEGRPLQCYEVGFIPLCRYLLIMRTYGVSRANMFCPSDPDVRPIDLLLWEPPSETYLYGSSYRMVWGPDVRKDFPSITAKRGMELPVFICHWHALERQEYPYRVLVIRINGQLTTALKTYDMDDSEL